MTLSRYPVLSASAVVLGLTLFLTWPQALNMGTKIAPHNDAFFSMWRLGWVGHALRVDPSHLYDANIYYPERRTLAYSDAMILEGLVAAPLLWSGLSPVLVYNFMLIGGIALSGAAMFVLARYLTGSLGAALVSAAIFTLVPYRVEHYMHLELQWTMWIPLALWAVHRAVSEGSRRFGALCGALVWLQLLSCVYYGVFLAMIVSLVGVLLLATERRHQASSAGALALGGLVALGLAVPYALPYLENAQGLGPRDIGEVTTFSAQLLSYVTTPYENWAWGWTADRFQGEELRLAPGVVAVALAVLGLCGRPSRVVWIYAVTFVVAVELSFGLNGHLYSWLHAYVTPLRSLRAIARFSVLAFCALAVLAGFGIRFLQERLVRPRTREWVAAAAIILVALECGSAPMLLVEVPAAVPDVYRVLAQLPRGVVAELPMAEPHWIPGYDPQYQYWSMAHWYPLVNGYSGYGSARYVDLLRQMLTFPDDDSIARLKGLDVRYVLVHQKLYTTRAEFVELILKMSRRHEFRPQGRYKDWVGDTELFELESK